MKKDIIWNVSGWTRVQDADPEKHVLEISVRAEDAKIVEARIRHNDGEEVNAKLYVAGELKMPMEMAEFKKLFAKKKVEFR